MTWAKFESQSKFSIFIFAVKFFPMNQFDFPFIEMCVMSSYNIVENFIKKYCLEKKLWKILC